jgi:hypothetical protein
MPDRSTNKRRVKLPDPLQGGGAILAGIVLLMVLSTVVFVLLNNGDSSSSSQPQPVMTLDPQTIINLTQLPQATPLSGADADTWNEFRAKVDACDAYSPERRRQMKQHIQWLIDPSDMPPDVIVAMGGNVTERLIFGMAGYTSAQWRLNNRPPDSCLVPIGRALNDMLVALGDSPIDIYN